jgi:hypothetical protein
MLQSQKFKIFSYYLVLFGFTSICHGQQLECPRGDKLMTVSQEASYGIWFNRDKLNATFEERTCKTLQEIQEKDNRSKKVKEWNLAIIAAKKAAACKNISRVGEIIEDSNSSKTGCRKSIDEKQYGFLYFVTTSQSFCCKSVLHFCEEEITNHPY